MDPSLAPYLEEEFEISSSYIGLIFSVGTIPYLLFTPLISLLTKKYKNYKSTLICIGMFICGFSLFFLGPDTKFTGLPTKIWIVCLGDGIMGIGNLFLFIPTEILLVEDLETLYPDADD